MSSRSSYVIIRHSIDNNHYFHYYLDYTSSDPYDDEDVKRYDYMLQQALTEIFRQRCHSSGQMKELLRVPEHTDHDSIFKLILEQEPDLIEILPQENKLSLLGSRS